MKFLLLVAVFGAESQVHHMSFGPFETKDRCEVAQKALLGTLHKNKYAYEAAMACVESVSLKKSKA